MLVYWEAVGNVTSSDIEPLNGSVELPHWDGAVSAYPNYNLTFLLLSDTQAEDKQVFSIRLTGTSSLTEIDLTSNSVTIIIRANDYPHGVFSIDANSMLISLNQELLSRMLNFTIVRNQGLQSAATVFYSLYYTDYGYTDSVHILSSSLIVPDGQMGYEEYIPISVSTFIGTNGNLTLRLTNVLLREQLLRDCLLVSIHRTVMPYSLYWSIKPMQGNNKHTSSIEIVSCVVCML